MRGNVLPARPVRRHRSTRRRQDAPDLPRRKVDARTVGKTYSNLVDFFMYSFSWCLL